MKNNIKVLLFSLVLGLGFVSCTDTFDENDNASVQPATPQTGFFMTKFTGNDAADYTLSVTLNAKGDTIVEMTRRIKENYRVDTYPEGKIQSYDPEVGTLVVVFPYYIQQNRPQSKSYQMYLTYKGTGNRDCAFVKMYDISSGNPTPDYTFTVYDCDAPEFGGTWKNEELEIVLTRGKVDAEGNADYISNVTLNGTEVGVPGTWSVNGTTCNVTVGNEVITLKPNARFEMVATMGGKEYILHR